MKLSARTFQVFFELHAWVSVVAGLSLYVIFFAGAFALFRAELDAWASTPGSGDPVLRELPRLQPLVEQLRRAEPRHTIDRVSFSIEPAGLRAVLQRGATTRTYDFVPSRGELVPARSELGSFLYGLHYFAPVPNGVYVAGLSALLFGLAIVSGVIVHWKDLVRRWFVFRPESMPRTWASDLHRALGLFGVPFQFVYAWSGAMLCLAAISVEPAVERMLSQGHASLAAIRGEPLSLPARTGRARASSADVDEIIARARRRVSGLQPNWVAIDQLGDEAAIVRVYGEVPTLAFGRGEVTFLARDGALLHASDPRHVNIFVRFEQWFYGLHFARFGGYAIRFMYALLALATCAVIVTGNLIWLERRDRKRVQFSNRILERLTVGCCGGLPLATAVLFVANRSLGEWMTEQSLLETRVFWTSWMCALVAPFVCRNARKAALAMLCATSAGFALVVSVDARSLGFARAWQTKIDWAFLALAMLFAMVAAVSRPRALMRRDKLPRVQTRSR